MSFVAGHDPGQTEPAGTGNRFKVWPLFARSIGARKLKAGCWWPVKPFTGKASARLGGSSRHGKGGIIAPSHALTGVPYTSGRLPNRQATSPPELIAAAHASSFSMTLADELKAAGYAAHQIHTTATVTMEQVGTRWTMAQVHLEVVATVPDGEQFDFMDATLRAKANCPVSHLLTANISMEAKLKRGLGATVSLPIKAPPQASSHPKNPKKQKELE